jgi:hypothetical protein
MQAEANMRFLVGLSAVVSVWASGAAADTWKEYTYPELGFAVSFPADPVKETSNYKAADGTSATKTLYSVRDGTEIYKVAIIDLHGAAIEGTTAIGQAVNELRDDAQVRLDIPARVNRNRGRQLSLIGKDASHSTVALFFADQRLYEIEGTVLAGSDDPNSGDAIRFQQSLRFIGAGQGFGPRLAGRGFQPGQGVPGRGFRGGRRFRQNPNPSDQTQTNSVPPANGAP